MHEHDVFHVRSGDLKMYGMNLVRSSNATLPYLVLHSSTYSIQASGGVKSGTLSRHMSRAEY